MTHPDEEEAAAIPKSDGLTHRERVRRALAQLDESTRGRSVSGSPGDRLSRDALHDREARRREHEEEMARFAPRSGS